MKIDMFDPTTGNWKTQDVQGSNNLRNREEVQQAITGLDNNTDLTFDYSFQSKGVIDGAVCVHKDGHPIILVAPQRGDYSDNQYQRAKEQISTLRGSKDPDAVRTFLDSLDTTTPAASQQRQ